MKAFKVKQLLGVFLGTIIEYYDYSLYGFSAAVIANHFFSKSDQLTNLTKAFAIYAVAYLSKPLGAMIFSHIGDNYGRKKALNITLLGVAVPTCIIGILPDYATIGYISTLILVICRVIQGIFTAGEYDGAAIYFMEHMGPERKATASSVIRFGGVLGLLLGIGLTNFFSSHIFPDWGWRIPFLLSVPFSLITLYYRKKLIETPVFQNATPRKFNIIQTKLFIRKYWPKILIASICAGSFGITYQIAVIFIKQYLPIVIPQSQFVMSSFSILVVACFGLAMPISGVLADKYSPMIVIKYSFFLTIVACIGLLIAISYQMLNLALASCLLLAGSVAPFNGLAHSLILNFFPVKVRYKGISFGHTIGSMIMSGSANYICLLGIKNFNAPLFPIMYLMFFSVVICIFTNIFFTKYYFNDIK